MVEVANLTIALSAEVAEALSGMRAVQKQTKDAATTADVEMKRMGAATKAASDLTVRELERVNAIMGQLKLSEKARAEISNAAIQGNAIVMDKEIGGIISSIEKMGGVSDASKTEIVNALKGVDTKLLQTGNVAAAETKKVEGFLGKWKLGWVLAGAAAIASLYAVAKSSAVMSGYLSEFGAIVGTVFDEIGIAMAPIIEPLLDFLWTLTDVFALLPGPVKAGIGAVIVGITGLLGAIPIVAGFKASLAALGISTKLSLAGVASSIGMYTGILAVAAGTTHGFYVTWRDAWDKMGREVGSAWAMIKTSLMGLAGGPAIFLTASLMDILGYGDKFQSGIDNLLVRWIRLWAVSIPNALMNGLAKIKLLFGRGIPKPELNVASALAADTSKVEGFLGKWKIGWISVSEAAYDALYNVLKGAAGLRGALGDFSGWLEELWSAGADMVSHFLAGIGDIGATVWSWISEKIGTAWTELKTWTGTFWEIGSDLISRLLEGIGDIGATVWSWISEKLPVAWDELKAWAHNAYEIGSDLIARIIEGIGDIGAAIWSWVSGKLGTVRTELDKWADTFYDIGFELVRRVTVGIGDIGSRVWSWITNTISSVYTQLWSWAGTFFDIGSELVNSLIAGIGDIGSELWSYIKSSLLTVSSNLEAWVSGTLSFSPSLLEMGAMIPQTIAQGAGETEMMAATYTPMVMPPIISPTAAVTAIPPAAPAAATTTAINITVPISITSSFKSETDLRDLVRKLKVELQRELRDLGRAV